MRVRYWCDQLSADQMQKLTDAGYEGVFDPKAWNGRSQMVKSIFDVVDGTEPLDGIEGENVYG